LARRCSTDKNLRYGSETAILVVPPSVAEENSKFRMFASVGTGETNGIYYPLGEVICGIVNQNLNQSGVRCSREMPPGSVYNADALRSSELECADPIRRGLRRLSWDWRLFRGPFPVLRPVLALLQDKSPVLENLTVQDIVTEALPAPLHPAALEAYRKLGLLK
jgi:TRAP-type uncharacterized transport system substrate-binding protein